MAICSSNLLSKESFIYKLFYFSMSYIPNIITYTNITKYTKIVSNPPNFVPIELNYSSYSSGSFIFSFYEEYSYFS